MHKITLFILAAVFAVALAEGQYYVPRAYYTIDAEGHESARVPLRRLRRSIQPYSAAGSSAEAHSGAYSANAQAWSGRRGWGNNGGWGDGGWQQPGDNYGASNPLSAGQTARQFGPVQGRGVQATSAVGIDGSGKGYYDQSAYVLPF